MLSTAAFILLILCVDAFDGPPSPASAPTVLLESTGPDLQRKIEDLSSPAWAVREDATWTLMDAGPERYDSLRAAFRNARHFDTRRRIKEIAREIYLTDRLGPPMAFLGISHNRYDLRCTDHPRVPPGCTALRIESVFPGTAADRGALRPGDLLVALNGKKATIDEPATNMTKWIASQKPGTRCRVGIVRGGEGVRVEAGRSKDFDWPLLGRLKTRVVTHDDNPLVPEGGVGFLLLQGQRLGKDVFIKSGDLVIGLNDQLIPREQGDGALKTWAAQASKAAAAVEDEDVEVRIVGGRPQLVPKTPGPSIQIVREARWLELDIRLGRRPIYLRSAAQPAWPADPAAVEQATSAFETWWLDAFDPKGTLVEQASADPLWRLEPGRN